MSDTVQRTSETTPGIPDTDEPTRATDATDGTGPVDTTGIDELRSDAGAGRNLAGPVVLLMSVGVLVGAFAVSRARAGDVSAGTQWLFWTGLLLIFVPAAVRVLHRTTGTAERVLLALLLALLLELSRTVLYPIFAYHDEFLHLTTLDQLERSHHLFSPNPLLPVAGRYPGLGLVTDAVHSLSGLSVHTAAVIVLLLARTISTLAIVGLIRGITGSTRAGAVAALVYTTNPQAIFFNAQFSYQSLALPLALYVAYAFYSRNRADPRRAMVLPVVGMVAVAVTHHLTAMLLVVALVIWAAFEYVLSRRHDRHGDAGPLAALAAFGAVVVGVWAALPGNPLFGYLGAIVTSSVSDIRARLSGEQSRVLFTSNGGLVSPLWERAALIGSILVVLVAIVPVFRLLRRWLRQRDAVLVLLGLLAVAYPIIPLGHVTPGTGEVTDRASGFLFLGVGLAVAVGPAMRLIDRTRFGVAAVSALVTVVFVGGVVLGAGPTVGQLPGPYLVSADARSVDAANLAAARWMRQNLPADTRVYADRVGGLLAAGIGGMDVVRHVSTGVDASRLLLDPSTSGDRALIRKARISYVIADLRDSTDLPNQRVYIESGEFGGENRTRPVPARALRKLDSLPGVQQVYSNGPVVIYDVRALQ